MTDSVLKTAALKLTAVAIGIARDQPDRKSPAKDDALFTVSWPPHNGGRMVNPTMHQSHLGSLTSEERQALEAAKIISAAQNEIITVDTQALIAAADKVKLEDVIEAGARLLPARPAPTAKQSKARRSNLLGGLGEGRPQHR